MAARFWDDPGGGSRASRLGLFSTIRLFKRALFGHLNDNVEYCRNVADQCVLAATYRLIGYFVFRRSPEDRVVSGPAGFLEAREFK